MLRILSILTRIFFVMLALFTTLTAAIALGTPRRALAAGPLETSFLQASQEFNVPEDLLKAVCQQAWHTTTTTEGHHGTNGTYGCGLVKQITTLDKMANETYGGTLSQDIKKHAGVPRTAKVYVDTLDQAANKLGVAPATLQQDLATNIRGVAYILSNDAQQLSATHQLPTTLAGWHPAAEVFSNADSRFTAHLYASQVYTWLQKGFTTTINGEAISVAAQAVPANTTSLSPNDDPAPVTNLPTGCANDGKTDYPGAVDCILDPAQHDCDIVPGTNAPCNYFSSAHYSPTYRQNDGTITHIVIHDIEGTAMEAISTFEAADSEVSAHYIVDTDGTVYQIVHEKDVAFQAGNLWMNQHSIGIEHAGFDATGFQYYNSVQYKASAKLTAYLAQKYNIRVDHNHIVSHGTVPSPTVASSPNHVDPGPYWLWDYYLDLIDNNQDFMSQLITDHHSSQIITLRPKTDLRPALPNGRETAANFNFFYLYNGPSTQSGLIPQLATGSDITDETNNVEPAMSYYYISKIKDPAGTGYTLYEIWYGESDQAHATTPSLFESAKLAWLAVPPGAAVQGSGIAVKLQSTGGTPVQISGSPKTNTATTDYHIGEAPSGAVFVSEDKVTEDGTSNIWYSINYNHRQAWIPAANVVPTI
jgi:N-acetyl-anhydromuramyl-L-alanine amidase AmpD